MAENTVALAAIGLVSGILALVVKPLFHLLEANTKAQNSNATAMNRLVEETRKGNVEAAERNGHLGEQNVQIIKLISKHSDGTHEQLTHISDTINKQTVKEQTVKHQTVVKEG